jgi:hypothetical protein
MGRALRDLLLTLGLALSIAASACATSLAASGGTGTFVASNCAPVAAASDGTMVWYGRNAEGVWDAYIGNGDCQGTPLLPSYDGNRGPSDITPDGRYVLLTTAVGLDKALRDSSPGQGSGNAIQLYDRQTGRLSTLLAGGTASQRGLIWPTFNSDDTKIVWSQMVKTAMEDPPVGEWALHVADVDLATGTLSDNVEWQDPDGQPAFYEAYGWVPNTNRLIFMSTTRTTSTRFRASQLFTLPEDLEPATAPTRISPPFAPVWPWQTAVDVFHEFAHFAPNEPNTLYTSIGADTVGDDLFSYGMQTQEASGLLGQPTRISYFGGDLNAELGTQAVPGWPAPTYTVVTTMAWVDGAWVTATCPDLLCSEVNAWRIDVTPKDEEEEGGAESPAIAKHPGAGPTPTGTATPSTGATRPGTTPGTTSSPTSPTGAPSGSAGRVALVAPRLTVTGRRASVELRCSERGLCSGRLTLRAKRATRRGRGRRVELETIGTAAFTMLPGTSARVKLRVNDAGRALLADRHGRLRATLTIASSAPPSSGGSSSAVERLAQMAVRVSGRPSSWS